MSVLSAAELFRYPAWLSEFVGVVGRALVYVGSGSDLGDRGPSSARDKDPVGDVEGLIGQAEAVQVGTQVSLRPLSSVVKPMNDELPLLQLRPEFIGWTQVRLLRYPDENVRSLSLGMFPKEQSFDFRQSWVMTSHRRKGCRWRRCATKRRVRSMTRAGQVPEWPNGMVAETGSTSRLVPALPLPPGFRCLTLHLRWAIMPRFPGPVADLEAAAWSGGNVVCDVGSQPRPSRHGDTGFALLSLKERGKRELANTKSAIKRVRQTARKRNNNQVYRTRARTFVKKTRALIADGRLDEAEEMARQAASALDKAAQKGIIHQNNAARRKGRLMNLLNQARERAA